MKMSLNMLSSILKCRKLNRTETSVGVLAPQMEESWCDFDEDVIFLSVTILLDVLKVK